MDKNWKENLKFFKKLSSVKAAILPQGQTDDAGGFNKLVDAQFSKINPAGAKYRFKSIKMRQKPKEQFVECTSDQESDEHDCAHKHLEEEDEVDHLEHKEEKQL